MSHAFANRQSRFRFRRDAEDQSDFFDTQSHKRAQLYDLSLARINRFHLPQRLIQEQEITDWIAADGLSLL